jgi:FtsZ-binding cell division protein ZapB
MSSELNVIATLQNEVKNLTEENNQLKKELEYYKKTRLHWQFSFSIRNIFK